MIGILIAAAGFVIEAVPTPAQLLWASGTQRGIELLWTPPADLPLPLRYTIRRAPSESERWVVIATTERTNAAEYPLALFIAEAEHSDNHRQKAVEQLIAALLDRPRAVGLTLGTYFHDTTTSPLAEYDYQVWAGPWLIATARGIVSHQRTIPSPPSHLGIRQRTQCVELWWRTDSALERGIVGYILYRARQIQSPTRLVQQPVKDRLLRADTTISCYIRDCSLEEEDSVTYYVAALDVFGNEGQPAMIAHRAIAKSLPQPGFLPHPRGESVSLQFDKNIPASQHLHVYARTSTSQTWRRLDTWWRDSLAIVVPPHDSADAIALASIATDGASHAWLSIPVFLPLRDTTAPTRPQFLEVQRYGERAFIRWTGLTDPDVAGYLIERVVGQDTIRYVVDAPMLWLSDSAIIGARYRMTTFDAHGNVSTPTPWTEALAPHYHRPNLVAVNSYDNGVLLQWRNPPGTAHVLVNRYDDTSATPLTIAFLDGVTTTFIDQDPTAYRSWYQIVTLDTAGRYSMPSERQTIAKQGQCTPPPLDSAVYRDGSVTVYWSPHGQGELLLERITESTDDVIVLTRLPEHDATFTDETVVAGETYTYRLRCVGSSAPLETSSVTIRIPP